MIARNKEAARGKKEFPVLINRNDKIRNDDSIQVRKLTCLQGMYKEKLTSSSEDDSSEDEQSIPESSSDESSSEGKRKTRRVAKYLTRIRRMRRKTKHIRKTSQAPRYEVEVVINGQVTKAFADTGADIPVMSRACAKKLGLKLCRTRMKIQPYGSKPVKSKHWYIGTVMYGDHVANHVDLWLNF